MYELSSFKDDGGSTYMMMRVTRKEALALILSLTKQLEQENPNSGREEAQYRTTDGKKHGRFSIAVQDPLICAVCQDKYDPFTGTKVLGEVICKKCAKAKCPTCVDIGGVHSKYCTNEANRRIEKAWAEQAAKKKK